METAAAVPQVDSQSLQPTTKPAYSPIARREKLYCPPLRGIEAPSSASEEAPKSAYIPPMTNQTPRTCRSLPDPRDCGPAAALLLVEDSADVLDNVKSQVCIGNSAIIMAMQQNASWKSMICGITASVFR